MLAVVLLAVCGGATVSGSGEPRCEGKRASIQGSGDITGTRGADIIVGSVRADRISGGGGNDVICGRGGDDDVAAGAGADRVYGGDGDDDVNAGDGNDVLRGESGDDYLTGLDGADDIGGGPGVDRAGYSVIYTHDSVERRPPPERVTLDGLRNDGRRGERDWIRSDVEGADGSGTFIGNARRNFFSASGTISGLGGDDMIRAGRGRVYGGYGNDQISKRDEADSSYIYGGPGNDSIDGTDYYYPTEARDTDSVTDWISCGSGRDKVTRGSGDVVRRDCERVSR